VLRILFTFYVANEIRIFFIFEFPEVWLFVKGWKCRGERWGGQLWKKMVEGVGLGKWRESWRIDGDLKDWRELMRTFWVSQGKMEISSDLRCTPSKTLWNWFLLWILDLISNFWWFLDKSLLRDSNKLSEAKSRIDSKSKRIFENVANLTSKIQWSQWEWLKRCLSSIKPQNNHQKSKLSSLNLPITSQSSPPKSQQHKKSFWSQGNETLATSASRHDNFSSCGNSGNI
jgi:hypothetical protein